MSPRGWALSVLRRVEEDDAYANLLLASVLARSGLAPREAAQVTDLVYGTIRWRRRLDSIISQHANRSPDAVVRRVLRCGVYELTVAGVPPHAAVDSTVAEAPRRSRGFVNAVLRSVARRLDSYRVDDVAVAGDDASWRETFSSLGEAMSYPDWIVERLCADLGDDRARAALVAMNAPPTARPREDGYVQDLASQWVAEAVAAEPGELVLDMCAAPGGKALWMARSGATVVAADARWSRAGLVKRNAESTCNRLGGVAVADGRCPPFRSGSFDRVLVDAPCSGLGVLRRRVDARWRLEREAIDRLAQVQRELLVAAGTLVRPGGLVVYSVCTLTGRESTGVAGEAVAELASRGVVLASVSLVGEPFEPWSSGHILLPQTRGTDGMCLFGFRRSA